LDGFFIIDKPVGLTSYGVVARVKRLSQERHVGHAGTLDPTASGVLPVCLGHATRVVEFLVDAAKTYRAVVTLGVATDTYDATGNITRRTDPSTVHLSALEAALVSFRGTIRQTPPMYSAIKHDGQPLYKLARAGLNIERPDRMVKVYRLDIFAWQPPQVTLDIECSKGTYIRSLANDLGEALGCGAHLTSLVRTRYGDFAVEEAVSLDRLTEAFQTGYEDHYLYPVDAVLGNMPALVVDEVAEVAMKQGQPLVVAEARPEAAGQYCRAYSRQGNLLGILSYLPDTGFWHPKKVFV
jgi:tRNA pseudouridine55 synthase